MKSDEGPVNRQTVEGWSFFNQQTICEQHPELDWPHDDCIGPGMPRACRGGAEFAEAQDAILGGPEDG